MFSCNRILSAALMLGLFIGPRSSLAQSPPLQIVANFSDGDSDGIYPSGELTRDGGDFYGTTLSGTPSGIEGTVFKISAAGVFKTLWRFSGERRAQGTSPYGGVVLAPDGSLYGTTYSGGRGKSPRKEYARIGAGTVFRLTPSGTFTVLVEFGVTRGANGAHPIGRLFRDDTGNLFGTTSAGGSMNRGTVFKLGVDGRFRTLIDFGATRGASGGVPRSGVIADRAGNLYGTTVSSQKPRFIDGDRIHSNPKTVEGTVFKFGPDGNCTTLIDFAALPGNYAAAPIGPVTLAPDGTLYGTTSVGGTLRDPWTEGDGIVWKLPRGGTLQTLVDFGTLKNQFAGQPHGALLLADDGSLYGTTLNGGREDGPANNGSVFKVRPSGELVRLATFPIGGGDALISGLTFDGAGTLWGTTCNGGTKGMGTVFKIAADATELPVPDSGVRVRSEQPPRQSP